jgi:hypothetical protein
VLELPLVPLVPLEPVPEFDPLVPLLLPLDPRLEPEPDPTPPLELAPPCPPTEFVDAFPSEFELDPLCDPDNPLSLVPPCAPDPPIELPELLPVEPDPVMPPLLLPLLLLPTPPWPPPELWEYAVSKAADANMINIFFIRTTFIPELSTLNRVCAVFRGS